MVGRSAVVLGGSGGIGLAIAEMLTEEGYSVTIQGRRQERVDRALARLNEISPAGSPEPFGRAVDLADEAAIVDLFSDRISSGSRLDCLVNSAGLGAGQEIAEITTKALDLQIEINLRAAVIATREALPLLKAAGTDHGKALIAHISSWAGIHPPAWLSIYGASKAALNSFARSTHKELVGSGVQVTSICPATVETDLTTYTQGSIPPEEMIRPTDLAEAVRFLIRTSPNCFVPELVIGRTGDLQSR